MMKKRAKCPHCGNSNQDLIESNRAPTKSKHYHEETLLCVARVRPEECVFGKDDAGEVDADGLVLCGMQWEVGGGQ